MSRNLQTMPEETNAKPTTPPSAHRNGTPPAAAPAESPPPTLLADQSVICFAKDWSEDPTSNNHVMRELSKFGRVLWLNSVATRRPSLASGRDLGKIFRKLASFFRGATQINDTFWVFTPLVLPLPHSRWAAAINRFVLALTLRWLRWRLGLKKDFQLWTFLPNVNDYISTLGGSVLVYYCTDEWSKFNYVNGQRVADDERRLCQRADIIFATARALVESKGKWNPETHLAPHGVDHPLFAKALDPQLPVPDDIKSLPRPLIGFYGTLQDWVDLDLIAHLAQRRPEWSIVLIGTALVDLAPILKFKNVHYLGRKPHSMLPNYCKEFSVGMLPQKVNQLTLHMNPIKLREYLCAGLPVVSVALPEVAYYSNICSVARTYDEFEAAVAAAISSDTPEKRRQRSDSMKSETWQKRVENLRMHVSRVKEAKCRKP